MPSVIIRRNPQGELTFYIAKKDQEEVVLKLEHEGPGLWGGKVTLLDGSAYYLDPLPEPPSLPVTLRARRADED